LAKNRLDNTKTKPSTTDPLPLNARGTTASLKPCVFQQHWPMAAVRDSPLPTQTCRSSHRKADVGDREAGDVAAQLFEFLSHAYPDVAPRPLR
jgi:hypothetical protein